MSMLLLPALVPEAAPALPRERRAPEAAGSDSVPYLKVIDTLPLRFQHSEPPPSFITRPVGGAPPVPPLTPAESSILQANAAAAQSVARATRPPDEAPVTEIKSAVTPPPVPAKPTPAAILPDDARPSIRPEDFLPYFQIPGSAKQANEVNVIMPASAVTAPAPAALPPSTATYTQSPK